MRFYLVDCFAEEKYQGNQLLVVVADRELTDQEQQNITREINFSETAFLLSGLQPNGGYDVRIWTPNAGEVPFAGHPTLGTAHVIHHILEGGRGSQVKLNLKAGQIPVQITHDGLVMKQNPPEFGAIIGKEEIAEIYGLSPGDIREDFPIQWVSTGLEAVIVPLRSREALKKLRVDRERFHAYAARRPECCCSHLFFTDMGNDLLAARCLMENFVEDPATGSANGDLAGYLLRHRFFGSSDLSCTVHQGEDMGRRSVLKVHAAHSGDNWLIEVGGSCFIVASGNWE